MLRYRVTVEAVGDGHLTEEHIASRTVCTEHEPPDAGLDPFSFELYDEVAQAARDCLAAVRGGGA